MAIRHRTKEVIAHDVAFVLNSPLNKLTKKAVLNNAAWAWTMFHGKKYDDCPYWSVEAKCYQVEHLYKCIEFEKADGRVSRPKRALIHNHAVPRRLVLQMLFAMNPATPEEVFAICDKFLYGVVITPEEDRRLDAGGFRQKMPEEFWDQASSEFENPWLRYRRCGIQLNPTPPKWLDQ